jgi:hypothetical protein
VCRKPGAKKPIKPIKTNPAPKIVAMVFAIGFSSDVKIQSSGRRREMRSQHAAQNICL